ncbi:MAG: hypothetical protein QM811_19715 [Pirellulales bacterium]
MFPRLTIRFRFLALASILGALCVPTFAQDDKAPSPKPTPGLWSVQKGLSKPDSACYDATTDAIYVANLVGTADAKDGKGYISKIGLDGKLLEEKWVAGLNAPKGLRRSAKRCTAPTSTPWWPST